jgi:GntP family gluconate:H+ symporter
MGAVLILLLGVTIVIAGVLLLRLPPFVALIGAALAVAVLTPGRAVMRQSVVEKAAQRKIRIVSIDPAGANVELTAPKVQSRPRELAVVRTTDDAWHFQPLGKLLLDEGRGESEPQVATARVMLVEGAGPLRLDDSIIFPADLDSAQAAGRVIAPERVATAFGATAAGIGILIAFASILGKCLLDSGAADRIVQSTLRVTGEQGAAKAFLVSGFVLGIPVFFDTVFYLLIPLGKAMRLQTGRNYLLYVLCIVAGATMTHSLVPPTPGPLVAAQMLGVNMGLMILLGIVVGIGAVAAGYLWAIWVNARYELPLRESMSPSAESADAPDPHRPTALPPLWLALAPIVLPVVLIGGHALWVFAGQPTPGQRELLDLVGNKNVAIIVAATVAVGTLIWARRTSPKQLSSALQSSLTDAGSIILITSAGGAFGSAIAQSGVASLVGQLPVQSSPAVLTAAFLVTVAIRTAQGSATVAMVTAAGIFAPLATSGTLGFHPVWIALAIGCGSKVIAWMNDSGFWVITQMSGMTEREGLSYATPMMGVMGIAGLAVTIAGALLMPMAS